MPRDTLPRGASLLALAGSNVASHEAESSATSPQPTSRTSAPEPRHEPVAVAPRPRVVRAQTSKQKVNARVSAALLDEVRDCVVALSGPPHGLTMDEFAEEAYRREIERLKRAHQGGQPFEKRAYNPRPGRRVT